MAASGGNKKRHSAQQKENYLSYSRTMQWKKNRIKKLERHTLKYPEDKNAEAALERVSAATAPRHSRKSKGTVCKADKPVFYPVPDRNSFREQLQELLKN